MAPVEPSFKPPYYAVIFSNQRTEVDAGYGDMAARMVALAAQQPGYLGVDSVRNTEGSGITVSYWRTLDDIAAWRRNTEHAEARNAGRAQWYRDFKVRIAKVEREYGWHVDAGPADPAA
ncbi:MAG: antibiotic biosynthesis monooxygenase [Burkholderiales bacterium]|nr:antibiotic biosynthesis monooxygenase [Burkholderiales bacterium]